MPPRQIRRKENMTSEEALKLVERIAKHPAPVTSQQAKRALIMLYLKTLENHLKSTKT
jgi:hypothetical protein